MPSRAPRSLTIATLLGSLVVALLLAPSTRAAGAPADDAWVTGYAAAVLERQLQLSAPSLRVRDGVVTLDARDIPSAVRPAVVATLQGVRGVRHVHVAELPLVEAAQGRTTAAGSGDMPLAASPAATPALGFVPGGRLFEPLLADPRWPRVSAAWRHSLRTDTSPAVFAASFGETMTFYRDEVGRDGRHGHWETGIQAGVFSILDLDAESLDLINSDFIVSIFGAYRMGAFSVFTRLYHQSSHLGDELLLRPTAPTRVNLSFEALDARLSYDLPFGLRVYGGGGYLVRVDPSDLERGYLQFGGEWRGPHVLSAWRANVRPVAGVDLQFREAQDWTADLSLRAGFQIDGSSESSRNLRLLMEYYNGRSLDGQFFRLPVEYVGVGVQYNF